MTLSEATRIVQEYVEQISDSPRPVSPTGTQQAALFIVVASVIHKIKDAMPPIEG